MSFSPSHKSLEFWQKGLARFYQLASSLHENSPKPRLYRFYRAYLSPLSAALLLLAAIFFSGLFYEMFAPPAQFQLPKADAPRTMQAMLAIPPFVPPDIETYAEIDGRPVFSPLRRLAKTPQAEATVLPPPNFVLVGVILQGLTRIGIAKTPGSNVAIDVTPGQTIGGWQVVQIEADRMELSSGSQVYTLRLQPSSGGQIGITQRPLSNASAVAQ